MKERSDLRDAEDLLIAEEVIAAMRHDLRNKLAAIRQAAYYLRTKTQATELWRSDPRIERFYGLIDEQIEAADALFGSDAVLDKLHARGVGPTPARLVADEAARATGEGVSIGAVTDAELLVDRAELVVTLRELLLNAVEATPADAMERPEVSGTLDGTSYRFTVTNPGPVLDASAFRTFVRGFTSSRDGRRGVGLSIARHVAARYGGTLSLRPDQARTTIDLTVRVAPTADEPSP